MLNLTRHELDMIVHALRTAAGMLEDTGARIDRYGAARELASEFDRRAYRMRALADRIEAEQDKL